MSEELKPCPFCGETPDLPSGDGTYYVIECGECGGAVVGIQISDLMTIEERQSDPVTDYRYAEQFIERAKAKATELWNTRATPPAAQVQGEREEFEAWQRSGGFKRPDDPGEWEAWQARAALSAPPAAGVPVGTLAGYVIPTCNPVEDGYTCTVNPAAEGKYKRPVYFAAPAGGVAEDARAALEAVRELVSLFADSEDDSYEPWKDVGMHPALRMTLGQYRALAKIFAPTPPASEPWRCQHCHSETAQACRDGGCFGVDAEPASEQQQAVVMPNFMESADSFADRLQAAGWRAEADAQHAGVRDLYHELLRLNPHLAGVHQGVTEAGNGGCE